MALTSCVVLSLFLLCLSAGWKVYGGEGGLDDAAYKMKVSFQFFFKSRNIFENRAHNIDETSQVAYGAALQAWKETPGAAQSSEPFKQVR